MYWSPFCQEVGASKKVPLDSEPKLLTLTPSLPEAVKEGERGGGDKSMSRVAVVVELQLLLKPRPPDRGNPWPPLARLSWRRPPSLCGEGEVLRQGARCLKGTQEERAGIRGK